MDRVGSVFGATRKLAASVSNVAGGDGLRADVVDRPLNAEVVSVRPCAQDGL
jgi:hypothetical protein